MEDKIKQRLFIVGCPRSGTTLLQAMLMASGQIVSFPESAAFSRLIERKKSLKIFNTIASSWKLNSWLKKELGISMKISGSNRIECIQNFAQALDEYCLKQGKYIWLEKTPEHLYYIHYIEYIIKNWKIIHIIRNPYDTIASLYEASILWKTPKTIEEITTNWLHRFSISMSYIGKPYHYFITYENLVQYPQEEMSKLASALEINLPDYNQVNLSDYSFIAIEEGKIPAWKKNNASQKIITQSRNKFEKIFTLKEQEGIRSKIKESEKLLKKCAFYERSSSLSPDA